MRRHIFRHYEFTTFNKQLVMEALHFSIEYHIFFKFVYD